MRNSPKTKRKGLPGSRRNFLKAITMGAGMLRFPAICGATSPGMGNQRLISTRPRRAVGEVLNLVGCRVIVEVSLDEGWLYERYLANSESGWTEIATSRGVTQGSTSISGPGGALKKALCTQFIRRQPTWSRNSGQTITRSVGL
jgi:hypothetical protein